MPTNHPLHPIAAGRLKVLADQLERQFSVDETPRKILNAVIYGVTAAQAKGMLEEFTKDRRTYNDLHADDPDGAKDRAIGGRAS
jgi:hypothetical protein